MSTLETRGLPGTESLRVFDWDRFVADHGPSTLRLACRILGDGPDAEDVVQEAFCRSTASARRRSVASWGGGCCIARPCTSALDRLRRRRASPPRWPRNR